MQYTVACLIDTRLPARSGMRSKSNPQWLQLRCLLMLEVRDNPNQKLSLITLAFYSSTSCHLIGYFCL